MSKLNITGHIFNVQSYCIHDGPGIRSTVFVKGCPLSCLWCQNPESQQAKPQLMFYVDRCQSCGACGANCPHRAIQWEPGRKPVTNRTLCAACGACSVLCAAGAREITGKTACVGEVLQEVLRDKMFFDASGGGMTVSGGEPLMQPEFTAALFAAAKEAGLHTAIESCNFASRSVIDQVYAHVDLALCDIKHMDPDTHRRLTGVPNDQILENIIHIRHDLKKDMAIRVPVVPGYNADAENISAIAKFVAEQLGTDVPLHLLPYHRLGESKKQSLELPCGALQAEPPSAEYMEQCKALVQRYGLTVHIGG